MDRHIFVCVKLPIGGVKPMCLICNGRIAVVKSSSVKIETMHMARFGVKFPPGSAARKEKVAPLQNVYERQIGRVQNFTTLQFPDRFRQRFSQFQSIAAIMDLEGFSLLIHKKPGRSKLQRWMVFWMFPVAAVRSTCTESKRQDLSTSG